MNTNVRNSLLAALALTVAASEAASRLTEQNYQDLFVRFAKQYDRTYKTEEIFERLQNFKENVDYVLAHNAKKDETFTVGLNQFADWSLQEFDEYLKRGFRAPADYQAAPSLDELEPELVDVKLKELPETVDWEEEGLLGKVRNQGSCGSCYAFSALGALEGRWGIARGADQMIDLSPQSIVDCDRYNGGCSGGFMTAVYDYLLRSRGGHACTEESYPYKGTRRSCKTTCESGAMISSYVDLSRQDTSVTGLMKAVAEGPVAVAVQANSRAIMNYKGGVITSGCPNSRLDHAVILYGYDKDSDGNYYWKIRNSWSEKWGNKGNFFVRFNPSRDSNLCGVRSMSSYPVVASLSQHEKSYDYSNLFSNL